MADPRLFRLRVVYAKRGRVAMLSHLEVARALERAVRRADLPFAVTNGFSPHMRIAFGAALPVGVGGTAEFFDLFMRSYVAPDKALAALQAASAPDLMPSACSYVEPQAPAASVACPLSTYCARFSGPAAGLTAPESIEVVRKKKPKTLLVAEYLRDGFAIDGDSATFTLEAKPTGSLRPDVLLDAALSCSKAAGAVPEDLHMVSIDRISQNSHE